MNSVPDNVIVACDSYEEWRAMIVFTHDVLHKNWFFQSDQIPNEGKIQDCYNRTKEQYPDSRIAINISDGGYEVGWCYTGWYDEKPDYRHHVRMLAPEYLSRMGYSLEPEPEIKNADEFL